MKKAFENCVGRIIVGFLGIFIQIIIDLFVASIFIISTAILAVFSLVCLALDWPTPAMLFGIALLSITLVARSHCWSQKPHPVDPETLDLIVAAEVAYLVLIKQGVTVFNCFVIGTSVAMAYLLPYR